MAFFNVLYDTSICSYAFLIVGEQSDAIGTLIPLEKQGTGGWGEEVEQKDQRYLTYIIWLRHCSIPTDSFTTLHPNPKAILSSPTSKYLAYAWENIDLPHILSLMSSLYNDLFANIYLWLPSTMALNSVTNVIMEII